MKVMRKTRISVALAAALAGVGASTQVMAVNKSADDIGDAFIGPYYTTRGGWSTDFTVINTSNSTVPVKVRFHEANNSREVLDFIVVLSPQDMVQAIVQEGPNGPRLSFPAQGETSCVVPNPTNRPLNGSGGYFDFNKLDYTGINADYVSNGPTDIRGTIDRAREGYFTIIAMGAAIPGVENDQDYVVPYNSNHQHLDCQAVIDAFQREGDDPTVEGENIIKTYAEFERNVNALKASYSLTNVARGVQGSSEMVTLANFATAYSLLNPTPTWQYWAKIQEKQYLDAYETAWTALNGAWSTLDAASTNSVAAGCNDNLGPKTDYIPGKVQDANPVDGTDRPTDSNPPAVTCGAGALAAYDDAAIAFNQAVAAHNNALDDLQDAQDEIATTRVRNLISAQGSFNVADPSWRVDSKYPNLDSGDLWAINNWDGEYLMGPLYCAHAFPEDWQLSGAPVLDTRGCPTRGITWFSIYLRGVDAVTNLLMTSDVINEWAVNPITGASSDWVLTAPTKRFYTDIDYVYPGIGNYFPILVEAADYIVELLHGKLNAGGAVAPFNEKWLRNGLFQSCDEVGYNIFNRDEVGPAGPGPQPSPHDSISLCNEVNVLYFNGAPMMDSEVAQAVSAAAPLGTNGWMGVDMTVSFNHPDLSNSQYHPALGLAIQHWQWVVGMPYVGFMMKERNLGQAASYGGIVEHSYIREVGAHNASIWDVWPLPPEDPCDFFPSAPACSPPPVDQEP